MQNICIANTNIWYKGSDYILQIQNLCITNAEILYKCSDYILQIWKLSALNTQLYFKNTQICMLQTYKLVRVYEFGATGAVPTGPLSAKITPLFLFCETHNLDSCFRNIKSATILLKELGAPPSVPAGALFLPKIDLLFSTNT